MAGKSAAAAAALSLLLSGTASAYSYNQNVLWDVDTNGKVWWQISNTDHTGDASGYAFWGNGQQISPIMTWNGSRFVPIKVGYGTGGVHFYSVNTKDVRTANAGSNYNNDGATGDVALAAGVGASAKGNYSIALGTNANVDSNSGYGIAIGRHASVTGGTSQGYYGDTASYGVAIGDGAQVVGNSAYALGDAASAQANGAVAIGQNSYSGTADSIALGSSSVVTENAGTTKNAEFEMKSETSYTGKANMVGRFKQTVDGSAGTTTAGAKTAVTGKAISTRVDGVKGTQNEVTYTYNSNVAKSAGALSIGNGNTGGNRRIQNVAAGLTAATSTDAVNGAQLYAVMTKPMTVTGNENQGSGTDSGSDQILGSKLTIAAAGTERTSGDYSGQNLKTTVSDGSVSLAMAKSPEFTKVTTGHTSMENEGLTVGDDGPSVTVDGINAGNMQITNVQSGGDVGTNAANIDDVKSHAKWTVKDAGTGSKEINSTTPLVVSGDEYVTTKVDDNGLKVGLDADKLGKEINITENSSITNINETIDKGTKYAGDDGSVITKQLGETLNVVGGAEHAELTDGNIGVNNVNGQLKVQLASALNNISSITNGPTTITIDGVNKNVNLGGAQITNMQSGGTIDSNGATIGDIKCGMEIVVDTGLKFAANNNKTGVTNKLGSKVSVVGADKKDGHEYTSDNLTTEITQGEDGNTTIKVLMDKDITADKVTVGKNGADGKDGHIGVAGKDGERGVGIDGKDGISVKGKDGKDGVTIKGIDGENGTEGQIGLTGPAGKDGTSTHADIGVNAGPASLVPEKNLSDTEMTRIHYTDEKGDHQVATMDDGLKFAGDDGQNDASKVISKTLNNTVDVVGGADSDKLTDGNIGVNNVGGKLKVQLAKDLNGISSITNGETSITLNETTKEVNVGGAQITNVASGGTTVTNAANIGDVNSAITNVTNELTNKGLQFAANDNKTGVTNKLGSKVSVVGADKKDGHEYTSDNLTTERLPRAKMAIPPLKS